MVTPDMLEEGEGEWFIKASLFNISEEEEVYTVQFVSFITKCSFWDTKREEWSIEGCQVPPLELFWSLYGG